MPRKPFLPAFVRWQSPRFRGLRAHIENTLVMSKQGNVTKHEIIRYGSRFLATFPEYTIPGAKRSRYKIQISPSTFESPVSVALKLVSTAKLPEKGMRPAEKAPEIPPVDIAEAGLGFREHAVIIESLKGVKDFQSHLDRFKRMNDNIPWAEHLVGQVENHARSTGFREVRIRKPEASFWYDHLKIKSPEEAEKIRTRMNRLYSGVATKMGYRSVGDFFVKYL